MIKVLSKGKRYHIKCEICNSKLEYGIEDITIDACDEICFERERSVAKRFIMRYLKCPVCGHYIPEKQLKPFKNDEEKCNGQGI